jgi:2-polyprenyl-6-methoxyphenol hydroxylase-like FAD-dependent oxidoreductase
MRVAVVGAGVAGSASAALLAGGGHDVTLFERAPVLEPVGAGVLVQPAGQLVLDRLGVFETVRARAARIDRFVAVTQTGRLVGTLRYGDLEPGLHGLGVHRSDLLAALTGLVERTGVTVQLGQELSGPADARLRGFDLVVGADGSRSAMRAGSGLARLEHEYRWGALWAIGRGTAVTDRLHQVVRGTGTLVGVLPLGGGRCNVFWSVQARDVGRLRRGSFDAWREAVGRLCPEATPPLSTLGSWDELRFTTYRHAIVPDPVAGRLVLIGDAAHPMSPHLGQGIGLALVDAWLLAEAIAAERSAETALARYAALRSRQIAYYGLVTMALTPFFQSRGVVKGVARDAVLPHLPRLPWVRRRMLLTLAGLAGGFRGRLEL